MLYEIIQIVIYGIPFLCVLCGFKLWKCIVFFWLNAVIYTFFVNGISPALFAIFFIAWIYAFIICGISFMIRKLFLKFVLKQSPSKANREKWS
jgi:hypothetical protein